MIDDILVLLDEFGSGIDLAEGVFFVVVVLNKFLCMFCLMIVMLYYEEVKEVIFVFDIV